MRRLGGRPWGTAAAGLVVACFVLVALGAGLLTQADPNAIDPVHRLIPPLREAAHPLGTDNLGRDVWTRLVFGARVSAVIGLASTALALVLGVTAGIVAGLLRGWVEDGVNWLVNVQLSISAIVLAICISAVLGNGFVNVILTIGITLWPSFARVARGETLRVLTMPYAEAATVLGAGRLRVALRHVLPNIAPSLIVLATLELGHAVVSEAALAFLGFGVDPRTPSWGSSIADGRAYLATALWVALSPAIALSLVSMSVNVLGDDLGQSRQE